MTSPPKLLAALALMSCSLPPSLHAESLKVSTLYTAPIHPANGVHPLWTPVQHNRGKTFVVVPDENLRPMVTQIDSDGRVTTVPLDPNPDYLASADGHNRFTMGIDKEGYLHIAGDMHGYAEWASTYVARYQYQNMMYWRSNKALDVTGGFTFAGGRDSASTLPGEEWGGDSRFFNDRNGELYFSSRVRAFTGGKLSGSEPFIAYGLYRYDSMTGRWTSIGGTAPEAAPGARKFNKVLYWEHTDAFEAYQCVPRFDDRNRLHFAIGGKTAGTEGQGLIYARSDDGGNTWVKANGTRIPGLPLRARDGEANQGDLVIRSPKVAQQSPVYVDRDGNVAVPSEGKWRTWRDNTWTLFTGGIGLMGPDGMLTGEGGSSLNRCGKFGEKPVPHETGFGQVFSLSELGLQTTGAIYGIGLPAGTNFVNAKQMSVFKAHFVPTESPEKSPESAPAPRIFYSRGEDARVWLSWTPVAGVVDYTVNRSSKAGPVSVIATHVKATDEFVDATCSNDIPYTYVVSANFAAGESLTSKAVTVTPTRSQARPPLVQSAVGGNGHITLRWVPLWPEGTSYTVKRAAAEGGKFSVIAKNVPGLSFTDFGLTNDQTYRYVVSASNDVSGESPDSSPISAAPFKWSRILKYKSIGYADPGTAPASAENAPRETAAQAFDGGLSSKWLMSANTGWLQYQFAKGEVHTVTRYRLISGQDGPERDPTDWQFQGSADGKTWVTLDAQSGQTFATRNGINTYSFENKTPYQMYRLNILKNNGNGLTQLAELELWEDGVVVPGW